MGAGVGMVSGPVIQASFGYAENTSKSQFLLITNRYMDLKTTIMNSKL